MQGTFKSGVVLLVTLALLTACGGSSPSTTTNQTANFKTSFEAVANQLQQSAHAIATAIQQSSKQTDAQIATAFHNLATGWQNQLSKLQTLKPPSNLSTNFNTVASAASRVEADLTSIASAAATHNAAGAQQASASLVSDILSAKAASTVIANKLGAK